MGGQRRDKLPAVMALYLRQVDRQLASLSAGAHGRSVRNGSENKLLKGNADKMKFLREKACAGVFVSKLIPVARTLISIPAGMVKMNFTKYTLSSACGVFLWNLARVGAGYRSENRIWIFWDRAEPTLVRYGEMF